MGPRKVQMGLTLFALVVVMLCGGSNAQSGGCTSALTSLAPCLTYITGNSSTPSASCCSQLSSVVQSSPQCLCSVISGAATSIGIAINQTQALQLPGACNVQTPPLNQCNPAANGPSSSATPPTGSPVASPADETPGTAITPPASEAPSGVGSKTVPATDAGSSNGETFRAPLNLVMFSVFTASCASIIMKL